MPSGTGGRAVRVERTEIPGCLVMEAFHATDDRGSLTKVYSSAASPLAGGVAFTLSEVFFTRSRCGVLRGMHLQEPPFDQHKLVSCVAGAVFDVLVDLRRGSPMEGRLLEFTMSSNRPQAILIPPGVAHGFLSLADKTIVMYCTTAPHSPAHDSGVRWNSVGATWPLEPTVVSTRDSLLPPMSEYQSPFTFGPEDRG